MHITAILDRLHLLESAIGATNDAVIIAAIDPSDPLDLTIVYVNLAFEHMTGYNASEVIGQSPRLLHGPDTATDALATMADALQSATAVRIELRIHRKDTTSLWIEAEMAPVADPSGQITHWIATHRDITARKAIEANLQRATSEREALIALRSGELSITEARFRAVWEAAQDAMAISDCDGIVRMANPAYYRLHQRAPEEILQQNFAVIFPPEGRESAMAHYAAYFASDDIADHTEATIVRADGSAIEVESAVSFLTEGGERVAMLSIVRDITERKRAAESRIAFERQLFETQRLEGLRVLAGGIAHDFNNILTSVMGHAELTRLDLASNTEARSNIDLAIEGAQRLAELTAQLLAYAGKDRYIVQPLSLNTVMQDMYELFQVSIAKQVTIELDLDPGLLLIDGDLAQVRQLLLNVFVNASEAIGERDGVIGVHTAAVQLDAAQIAAIGLRGEMEPGWHIQLMIDDDGCGMDAATLARMFDPFFSTKALGRGLGLAAVQGIVCGHRGGLVVTSQPGCGTSVSIYLPASASAQQRQSPGGSILVIDEEEMVRNVASRLIERIGYCTVMAKDGREALLLLSQGSDALAAVVLDPTIAEVASSSLIDALRASDPTLPIVLMSGYSVGELDDYVAGRRQIAIVQKPFTSDALRRAIARAIAPEPPQPTSAGR